jgi:hypothetical protein
MPYPGAMGHVADPECGELDGWAILFLRRRQPGVIPME